MSSIEIQNKYTARSREFNSFRKRFPSRDVLSFSNENFSRGSICDLVLFWTRFKHYQSSDDPNKHSRFRFEHIF